MAFEPITTQEALDSIISERLKREKEKVEAKYSDYGDLKNKITDYEKQFTDLNKQLESLSAKEKEIEDLKAINLQHETSALKTRLAHEAGLPYGSNRYISGTNENEIKESIKDFQAFVKSSTPSAPLASPEPTITEQGKINASNKELLAKLKGV